MSAPYTQSLATVLDMISALDHQTMLLVEQADPTVGREWNVAGVGSGA